ncbi:unnamed protein product [Effrenium voratum]|nr:unnamed protein product [Effrenium voratum]
MMSMWSSCGFSSSGFRGWRHEVEADEPDAPPEKEDPFAFWADYDAEMDEYEPFEDATQPAYPEQADEATEHLLERQISSLQVRLAIGGDPKIIRHYEQVLQEMTQELRKYATARCLERRRLPKESALLRRPVYGKIWNGARMTRILNGTRMTRTPSPPMTRVSPPNSRFFRPCRQHRACGRS